MNPSCDMNRALQWVIFLPRGIVELVHILSFCNLMLSVWVGVFFSTFFMSKYGQSRLYRNTGSALIFKPCDWNQYLELVHILSLCILMLPVCISVFFSTFFMSKYGQSRLYRNTGSALIFKPCDWNQYCRNSSRLELICPHRWKIELSFNRWEFVIMIWYST